MIPVHKWTVWLAEPRYGPSLNGIVDIGLQCIPGFWHTVCMPPDVRSNSDFLRSNVITREVGVEGLLPDVRFALRQLRKNLAYTVAGYGNVGSGHLRQRHGVQLDSTGRCCTRCRERRDTRLAGKRDARAVEYLADSAISSISIIAICGAESTASRGSSGYHSRLDCVDRRSQAGTDLCCQRDCELL